MQNLSKHDGRHDQPTLQKTVRTSETKRGNLKARSEEHTSELQSRSDLVCRLLLEKKKKEKKKKKNKKKKK